MKIKYFVYKGIPKAMLMLQGKHIGTYNLSSKEGIKELNYDLNWCHRQLAKRGF
tara:strand:- start:987 stop:1148 length:162 start_codon:yes stop_codon:yes gene_type:complete